MTRTEQRLQWIKFSNFQQAIERKCIPKVLQPMQSAVNAFVQRGQTKLDELGLAGRLIPVLNNLYYQCGYAYGYGVYKQYKNIKAYVTPEDIAREVVNELRLSLLINVNGIEASIKEAIISKIQQGSAQGWGFEKTSSEIQGVADIARSRRIVRTESVKGSNLSAILGAKRTGLMMNKIWISAKDNRVRGNPLGKYPLSQFDHWDLSGTTIGIDQKFFTGSRTGLSEELLYPGDPSGSPANICNCRCVVSFIPQTDEFGRVIRTSRGRIFA